MRRYVLLGTALAALMAISLLALVPSADDLSPDNPLWNGISEFVRETGARPVPVDAIPALPRGSALFVIGPQEAFGREEALKIRSFVEGGGVLVVADDFGSSNGLLEALGLGVRLNGSLLLDPLFKHRADQLPAAEVRLGGAVLTVYLNYATALDGAGAGCFGRSSSFSYLDLNLNLAKDVGEPYGPFCVAYTAAVGSGRVYVLSDSSVFINSMIRLGDNLRLAEEISGNGAVYVLVGKSPAGLYARLRGSLAWLVDLLYLSPIRYLSLSLTALLAYYASSRLFKLAPAAAGRGLPRGAAEELVERDPSLDLEVLKKLEEDLGDGDG